jgi:hypothetical protein
VQFRHHFARSEKWRFQILLVQDPHDFQIRRRRAGWLVVQRRSRNTEQYALPFYGEFFVVTLD